MNVAHLPTLLLAIGYPIFWAEMYSGRARDGVSSPWAWILFIVFVLYILWREKHAIVDQCRQCRVAFEAQDRFTRIFLLTASLVGIFILGCVFCASLLPPHLIQESDVMNYHYSLPRQHLILGSFNWIRWSPFDLFLLPVDYALAPYWFVTVLPNKVPQFIFLIGLFGVLVNQAKYLQRGITIGFFLAGLLLLGSHGHGIQMGTAMLDMVNCYLFLAAIDSFFRREKWLFILEFSFYLWSKPFVPFQVFVACLLLGAIFFVLRRLGYKKIFIDFQREWTSKEIRDGLVFLRGCLPGLLTMTVVVAAPFLIKSFIYTGTPFYPLAFNLFKINHALESSVSWASLKATSDFFIYNVRDGYGYGRSLLDFIKHFWLIAVPNQDVNNAFDYPLGLSYLIVLGPFLFYLYRSFVRRNIVILPLLSVILWLLWFMGCQQSRWLYVPLVLMFLSMATIMPKPSKVMCAVIGLAVIMNTISIFRAHQPDFGHSRVNSLRAQDAALVELSRVYFQEKSFVTVSLSGSEVAFAQFPVTVIQENLPNSIKF